MSHNENNFSLFIGNISHNVELERLEKEFEKFGECEIDLRVTTNTHSSTFTSFSFLHSGALSCLLLSAITSPPLLSFSSTSAWSLLYNFNSPLLFSFRGGLCYFFNTHHSLTITFNSPLSLLFSSFFFSFLHFDVIHHLSTPHSPFNSFLRCSCCCVYASDVTSPLPPFSYHFKLAFVPRTINPISHIIWGVQKKFAFV